MVNYIYGFRIDNFTWNSKGLSVSWWRKYHGIFSQKKKERKKQEIMLGLRRAESHTARHIIYLLHLVWEKNCFWSIKGLPNMTFIS